MATAVILVFFTILFICHKIVYEFFVRTFGIEKRRIKIILFLILFYFSLSFIICTLLVRWKENALTRFLYFCSGIWLGVVINLFLAVVVAFVITLIVRLFGKKANLRFLSIFVIIFVVSYTGFGIWNVFHPQIKNITVKIKDLPEWWKGKKIVQISDAHLGNVLGENFLKKIVRQINSLKPDMVVITGDLIDGSTRDAPEYLKLLEDIKTDQGVYSITGNHEIYSGVDKFLSEIKNININTLNDKIADVKGLQLIGISYPRLTEAKNIKNFILNNKDFDPQKPSILLFHSPTSINHTQDTKKERHERMYWRPNTDFSDAKELGIDLQLSGHSHAGQIFPFGFVTQIIYSGYDYGLKTDGDFSIYTSSGVGVWGPTMRTGSRSEIVAITLE
ncbi:MAG: metallophosphoesterase [bacterium]